MLHFLWLSTRGYRLRPWAHPYLRWRMETYWGVQASSMSSREFSELVWSRRCDLWRFLRWAGEMRRSRKTFKTMAQGSGRSARAITAIALFKLIKGVALAAAGVGALSLLHKNVEETVTHWIQVIRIDPDNEVIHSVASRMFAVTPMQLKEISAGTFFYAALLLIEGVGLLMRKQWAEYFTVITTTALIPVELYEIARQFTGAKLCVLLLNVAIVVYLIWRIRTAQEIGKSGESVVGQKSQGGV